MPNYTGIEVVKNYGEYLEDVFWQSPLEYSLEQISYSRWAISELLARLKHSPPDDELTIMEKLSNELVEFSRLNPKTSRIFLIAYEIVGDAMDLYISQ